MVTNNGNFLVFSDCIRLFTKISVCKIVPGKNTSNSARSIVECSKAYETG